MESSHRISQRDRNKIARAVAILNYADIRNNASDFVEQRGDGLSGQRLAFWQSNARFPVGACGRRSGKTVISEWKLERKIWTPKPWRDARYFFAGPTQGQAEQIGWQRMLDLIERSPNASRIHKINNSDLIITVDVYKKDGEIHRASFHIIGLDSPQRMEGRGWDGGIGDERADWKRGVWDAHLRPSLADRRGFCYIVGTPDFRGPSGSEFRDQFDKGILGVEGYESFSWPSREVISLEEVEAARSGASPAVFRQEYEASWESAPGRAYQEFTRAEHVNDKCVYDPSEPALISLDFNRGHHNWGMYQFGELQNGEDGYRAFDEVYLQDATVEAMCHRLDEKLIEHKIFGELWFFGDHSGEAQKAEATDSAWQQVRNHFKERLPKPVYRYMPQGPIADRVDAVNAQLRNASGLVRTEVNPRCSNLIRDFEDVTMDLLYSSKKTAELSHASDNFGYMVGQHSGVMRLNDARAKIRTHFNKRR